VREPDGAKPKSGGGHIVCPPPDFLSTATPLQSAKRIIDCQPPAIFQFDFCRGRTRTSPRFTPLLSAVAASVRLEKARLRVVGRARAGARPPLHGHATVLARPCDRACAADKAKAGRDTDMAWRDNFFCCPNKGTGVCTNETTPPQNLHRIIDGQPPSVLRLDFCGDIERKAEVEEETWKSASVTFFQQGLRRRRKCPPRAL